ncbi:MAG: hypothetical protein AAF657_28525, partial [Acidobacteriota bacterium]
HHRLDFQAKDRSHERELGNDKELRRHRDEQARALHTKMSEISKTFDGAYGDRRCQEVLGFGEGLRPEPEQMLELPAQALERLQAPDFALPEPHLGGVDLSIDDLTAQLAGPHADLAAAITALDSEKDKFDASGIAKRESERRLNEVTVRHARLVEELYRIGGFREYADRLRPRARRARREDEVDTAASTQTADEGRTGDDISSAPGSDPDTAPDGGSAEGGARPTDTRPAGVDGARQDGETTGPAVDQTTALAATNS